MAAVVPVAFDIMFRLPVTVNTLSSTVFAGTKNPFDDVAAADGFIYRGCAPWFAIIKLLPFIGSVTFSATTALTVTLFNMFNLFPLLLKMGRDFVPPHGIWVVNFISLPDTV
jgi:hypothetical protein